MSLILKSNERAPMGGGKDIFNLGGRLNDYELLLDFSTQNYLLRNNSGDLDRLSFDESVIFSRTGRTEYYDPLEGWKIAESGEPAFHYDIASGASGILNERGLLANQQIINRRGSDVLSSETVTTTYKSNLFFMIVKGSGSVTVSGDLNPASTSLTASVTRPASFRIADSGDGTSTLTFTVSGSVDGFMCYISPSSYGGVGFIPYETKESLESKGQTNIELSQFLKDKLSALNSYTVMIDSTPFFGYPKGSVILRVGSEDDDNTYISVSEISSSASAERDGKPLEKFRNFTNPRRLYNDPSPLAVESKGEFISVTNGLDVGWSTQPINITGFDVYLGEPNRVISRFIVYPRALSDEELRELSLAWSRYK